MEAPAGTNPARQQRIDRDDAAEYINVPTQQVDPRKGKIFRTNHHWNQKVSERCRNRWDQKEEDHDDPMLRKHLVVSARLHEVTLRSQQLQADRHRIKAANEEEEADRAEIKQRDALVIPGQQPRLQ